MFFHLLYIHLFRPFLKYNPSTSPLPSHVPPRKLCTQAANSISKLMRLYKRTYGLRQICNIAVYIVHSACTIHLLDLPDKTAKGDIIHGVKHLEEIAEDWLCARRTLSILSMLASKWKINLPEEATIVFRRTDAKYRFFSTADVPSPKAELDVQTPPPTTTSSPRSVQRSGQRPQPNRSQNQLQQSLYRYTPEPRPTYSNDVTELQPVQPSQPLQLQQNMITPPQPLLYSIEIGSMSLPNVDILSTGPYVHNSYENASSNIVSTPSNDLPRSDSTEMSESTARQVSPSTLFGGVDALVESQDWWLRDQASLAIDFDNWMGVGNNGAMNGVLPESSEFNINKSSADIMRQIGGGFYMSNGGDHSAGPESFPEDYWKTYT